MTLPKFYTAPQLTDPQLIEAIARIRKILTYATGEYVWELREDLDALVAEQLRRRPEGEARAMGGDR